MSLQSGFSRRWQKVRRASGRTPLRIKLISAVLVLVLIALGAISIAGLSVLRSYLLGQASNQLAAIQGYAQHDAERCLDGNANCPLYVSGAAAYWLPTNGHVTPIWLPAEVPAGMLSQSRVIPGPAIQDNQAWVSSISGQDIVVPAETGGGRWLVTGLPATDTNQLTGQVTTGVIILGVDVTSVYNTLGTLAHSDLSRRVPDRDPRTEVGRLGRSLNAMLAQVEAAFHAREKSEAAARRSE